MTARKLSGVFPMINAAREELKQAHAARSAAESARDGARQATNRARALLEEVIRQSEVIDANAMRAERERLAEMKESFLAGSMPTVAASDKDAAETVAERAALDIRRAAGEAVVADLAAEEREREREVSEATAAVERAVQNVLRSEVEKIEARWVEVDREARALRIKLGREGDPVWRIAGQSDAGRRATGKNIEDAEFDFRQRQAASAPWLEFSSALISDPDARLDFAAGDLAIEEMRKERAERRETDERFVAKMRGEAA